MLRIALPVWILGAGLLMAGLADAAGPPGACAALSHAQAFALAGAPLDTVSREDSGPTAENGHDHTTACGYFPRGYDIAKADNPPERGIMLTLHEMPDRDAARRFYEQLVGMAGTSVSQTPGAKINPLGGLGEAAYLQVETVNSNPPVQLANIGFYKGSVMGFIQVWLRRPPGDVAQRGARQIISKLP
jgi:hypothetical protein